MVTDAAASGVLEGSGQAEWGWAGGASGQSLCLLVGLHLRAWAQPLCQTDRPALLWVGDRPVASGSRGARWAQPAPPGSALQGAPSRLSPPGSSESSVGRSLGKIPPTVPGLCSFKKCFPRRPSGPQRPPPCRWCLIEGPSHHEPGAESPPLVAPRQVCVRLVAELYGDSGYRPSLGCSGMVSREVGLGRALDSGRVS